MIGIALSRAVSAALLVGALLGLAVAAAADPSIGSLSPDQIQSAVQSLPPQVRQEILQQMQGKSTDDLMHMSPDQVRAAAEGLSPDMKAQLKSQWESMSADQKAALKQINVHAIMQKLQAMTGPELAYLRKMLEQALGK